jgi:prophage regulatory protein
MNPSAHPDGPTGPNVPQHLLTRPDLRERGIRASNPTLLAWEAEGRFPKRLHLSAAKVAWLANEVDAWVASKAAARR